jgi:hypothetical protein
VHGEPRSVTTKCTEEEDFLTTKYTKEEEVFIKDNGNKRFLGCDRLVRGGRFLSTKYTKIRNLELRAVMRNRSA